MLCFLTERMLWRTTLLVAILGRICKLYFLNKKISPNGCEMLTSGLGTANLIIIFKLLWLPAMGLPKNWPASSQALIREAPTGHYFLVMAYWLLLNSGGRVIFAYSCVPGNKPTRLQWIVPNHAYKDYSWLNLVSIQ